MLNAKVTIVQVPGASAAGAGPGAAEAAVPGFAQALDRAATRPQDEHADDGGGTEAPSPPARRADEAAHGPAAPRHANTRQAETRSEHGGAAAARGGRIARVGGMAATTAAAAGAGATAATDAAAAKSLEANSIGRSESAAELRSDEDPASGVDPAEASSQDLAAWLSTLPLPRPPAGGTAANAADDAERRGAVEDAETGATGPRAVRRAEIAVGRGIDTSDAVAATAGHDRPAAAGLQSATQPVPRPWPETASRHGRAPVDAVPMSTAPAAAASARDEVPGRNAMPEVGSAMAALMAAPTSMPARQAEVSHAFQAELRAAVGSEGFAPALGSQLSVLVRDGIEHAQLKLNPAELGPIEVRIDVDGNRAQVDFSATQALTRQALQDAVPALATALRESGLTLTGGGVFEQPREQRGEARQDGTGRAHDARGEPAESGGATAALPHATRTRGVVDLYA